MGIYFELILQLLQFFDFGFDNFYVWMFLDSQVPDWAKYGLQCNAIAPGYFDTPLNAALVSDKDFTAWLEKRTPAGRWGKVEELVGASIFLSSDASNFVNGHTLYVDGGITASL